MISITLSFAWKIVIRISKNDWLTRLVLTPGFYRFTEILKYKFNGGKIGGKKFNIFDFAGNRKVITYCQIAEIKVIK